MNHEPLDRLHLQQIAAAYAAGYRMARAELADDTKYYTLTQCYRNSSVVRSIGGLPRG